MSSGSSMGTRSRRTRTPQVLELEPHMSLQRPSSAWSQDIAHILDRCFGATFSEQSIEVETIRNFTPGSDAGTYQRRYADRLKTALHQFDTLNNLLDSADKRNSDLHSAFISLFASEQFESPASTLSIPPRSAPDKSLLDLSLFEQTSLISPDSYYPFVFTRYHPPTRDPSVRPSYENATQNWEEKGTALPLIKDTNIIRQQPHSNTSRTLKSQVKNRPKRRHEVLTRNLTPQPAKPSENFISSVNSDNYFISEPSELIFDSYEPHKTYIGQILLRNVSRYIREFRIFTPKTEFFALAEETTNFNIAPGMTSQISVAFTPDSFGNYFDQIKVVSEDNKSFFIQLTGARPSPVLSLPYTLDCGNSIVDVERKICYTCTNSGGAGYFAFSLENIWFDPSLPNENMEKFVVLNKFVISPVLFELKTGESLDINIHFSPDSENEFLEEIFLHCSNKTTISFELYGLAHYPKVEIFSLNQTQTNLDIDPATISENGIQITSQIFKCLPVTLGHKSHLEITVKNLRPILLNVKWAIIAPEDQNEKEDSIFKITPENTTIDPSENHDFCVTFTPQVVCTYYGCLQLLLLTESSPIIATLYLEAECQDVCIVPLPPLIESPGTHLIGSAISHSIQLWNHGCSPVAIEWVTQPYENDIEITPSTCELAPDQYLYFSVHISRSIPGVSEHILICKIEENDTLIIPLKCQFRAAEISIDQIDLNLGLVPHDVTINHTFSITNKDNTKACVDLNTRDLTLHSNTLIKVNPTQIEIGAFSSSQIELEISTVGTGEIDCIIECIERIGGSIALLPVTGLIQRPIVVVENSPIISLGDIFVNVPNVTMVTLRNLSKLPAAFGWNTSVQNCEFCDEFRVNFSSKNGRIEGLGSCEVEIEITCLKILGIIEDILIVCNVENADEPVILSISCEVKGMSVTFSHNQQPLSPQPNGLPLDFGTVTINSKNILEFIVTNNTDISAPIKLWVDKFPADESAGQIARGYKRPGQEFDVYLGEDTLKKRLEFDEKR
ncbi:Deleted in lung and esophageal cancer protein 1 [Oopsacas minuta]|uniref:Deleted in lung and esophageal cancer protein 1 n=1 Tax=Oopsacas minuta TaxID=111878 RepID=A0AAV7JES0_9METZ|nr:Deleted in lung and esophageal cancer protein 1 [Oopsacas minuta]